MNKLNKIIYAIRGTRQLVVLFSELFYHLLSFRSKITKLIFPALSSITLKKI